MKKFYSFILILFLAAPSLFSQPWQSLQSNPSVSISDMSFLSNGMDGWAVGSTSAQSNYLNGLYRTTDGGLNWNYQQLSNTTLIQGVFFVDANTGWIVGSSGSIYKSTNGGLNWFAQNSGSGRILYKVYFINANTGWVVGGRQDGTTYHVLKTTNGGANWQDQSFGSGNFSTEGLFFLNDMTGWVSGIDNTIAGAIHKTTNGGLTWTRKTVPSTTTSVTSIKFANANTGWATSSSIYNSGPIYYSSNGGETWTVQTNTNQHYHYVDVKDDQNVAIVGYKVLGSTGTHVFTTSNGGINWIDHSTPISNYTRAIKYIGNNIWIGADYSQILKSTNSGINWNFQYRSYRLRSVTWLTNDIGFITGNTISGSIGYSLKTTNGGLNWFPDPNSPGGAQILFVNANYGWVLWEGNSAYIWRTSNGGNSWTQNYIPASGWTGGIHFINENTGWAFGSNGNLRFTTNSGATWTAQNPASSNYVSDVQFINQNEGWLGGGYGGGNGFISHTTNTGQTWTPQTPASSTHILDLYFLDNNYGWATMFGGSMQRTTNGGTNWFLIGSLAVNYAEKIFMINQNTGWLIAYNLATGGGNGLGYIYKTTNGGNSWVNEYTTTWPRSDLTNIGLQGTNTLWVTGNHSTILKYDISSGLTQHGSTVPEEFNLYQNYPNPFNPATKIKFDIPRSSSVKLIVYDILGKEVATLVNEKLSAGSYKVEWYGTDYPSGVYFYKLVAGDFTDVKRMLLIK